MTRNLCSFEINSLIKAVNVIEGKSGYSPAEDAKERLQESRKKIAQIIRKQGGDLSDGSDEFDESPVIPMKKRRKIKIKAGKNKKRRRKNYSIYQDFEVIHTLHL